MYLPMRFQLFPLFIENPFFPQLLIFSDEKNTKILLDTLVKLGFYSNLQKVLLMNYQLDREAESRVRVAQAEEHFCKIMKSPDLENLQFAKIFEIHDSNVKDNVIKYLLDFNKMNLNSLKPFKQKLEDTGATTFMQLLVPIMVESEKDFRPLFTKHIRKLRKEFNVEDNKVIFTADCNVLFQHAFQKKLGKVMSNIIQNHLVDVNNLVRIDDGQTKRFSFYAAEKGYPDLLQRFLEREDCEVMMTQDGRNVSLFNEAVRGHCINKSSIYNPMLDKFPVDFDKCIRMILSDSRFKGTLQSHTPMIDAIKYNYEYASFQLLEKCGLSERTIGESTDIILEKFLNSRVHECDKSFRINYDFLNNAKSDECIPTLSDHCLTHIANSEARHLVRHPVLSLYIDLKSRRFEILHQICLILFVTFFVIPFVTAHFLYRSDRVMGLVMLGVPIIYLLVCETIKLFFYYHSVQSEVSQQTMFERFLLKYFGSASNVLDVLLIVLSIATFIALLINCTTFLFQIVYSIVILLMALELLLLLTAAFQTLRIYLLMLKQIVFTYGKIFTIFILFIFAFTFSFHVIFYNAIISKDNSYDANHTNKSKMEPNNFSHLWSSFVKTHIMLIGDYDATTGLTVLNGWWWIFFVLSSIIFFNFLNGLAVFDVQV